MEKLTVEIKGMRPLLMHNRRLADPRDKYTRMLKEKTAIRAKTDDVLDEIAAIEWRGGLYLDETESFPVITADMLLASLYEGASKSRLKKKAKAAVIEAEPYWPLIYDGPKNPEELFEDDRFVDYRGVVVGGRCIFRTRPIFREWSLKFNLLVDISAIETNQIIKSIEDAGQYAGLGDYRPRFGLFSMASNGS